MRAITAAYEEIATAYAALDGKIQRDSDGIEMVAFFPVGDGLETMVWTPIAKKVRRQPSAKAMNAKANIHDWEVQCCEGGFEIVCGRSGVRIDFAKTQLGINRKLTAAIEKKVVAEARKRLAIASPNWIQETSS